LEWCEHCHLCRKLKMTAIQAVTFCVLAYLRERLQMCIFTHTKLNETLTRRVNNCKCFTVESGVVDNKSKKVAIESELVVNF